MSIFRKKPNKAIEDLMDALVEEYKNCKVEARFFSRGRTNLRKSDILKQIASLRASMSPQCNCKQINQNESP